MPAAADPLRLLTVLGLGAVSLGLLLTTCALDRLEQQVIRLGDKLGDRAQVAPQGLCGPQPPSGPSLPPGEPLGCRARGWGGREAEILSVEGAITGAPILIAQKEAVTGKAQGDVLVQRRPTFPRILNPYLTNEGEAQRVANETLGSLLENDPRQPGQVRAGLAIRWETSEDNLTTTYHLRRGVRFADGRPFTAKDVVYSFDTLRDPAVNAESMRGQFQPVASLDAVDDYTVRVSWREPYWAGPLKLGVALKVLNHGWLMEHLPRLAQAQDLELPLAEPGQPGFAEAFNALRFPPPGTGPYYYPKDTYDGKSSFDFLQNPFYWGIQVRPELYNFDALRWILIADEQAALEAFRRGEFDLMVTTHAQWEDTLAKDPTVTDIADYYAYDHTGIGYSAVFWNLREGPFQDPLVRRAMTHLFDREWMKQEFERGNATVAALPIKRAYPEHHPRLEPWPFDVQAAGELLAQAGYVDSDGDGVREKNGEKLIFDIIYPSPTPFYQQGLASFQGSLKQVGGLVNPQYREWATFISDLNQHKFVGVMLYISNSDAFVDPFEIYHSSAAIEGGNNLSGWANPESDRLLEEMRRTADPQARAALAHRWGEIFHQEQPATLLLESMVGSLAQKRFEGREVLPSGLRPDAWWVRPENQRY